MSVLPDLTAKSEPMY